MNSEDARRIVIRDEGDAVQYLREAIAGRFANQAEIDITFEDWPELTLRFVGKGYESTITPDIAEALIELQHALNRAFARAVHGSSNARHLTADERRGIQLKAKVDKGSSLVKVDIGEYAEKLAQAVVDKMTPEQIVITVLGSVVIFAGQSMFKAWLKQRTEDKRLDGDARLRTTLSKDENERIRIVTEAMSRRPELIFAGQDMDDVRREIMRSAPDAQSVSVHGMEFSAKDAYAIASTPRTASEEVQLNGHYTIAKVDLSQPDFVRLTLASTDGLGNFVATLKAEKIQSADYERLKSGTWGRQRLYMAINGTRLRGEVTTASIVSVDWPKEGDTNGGSKS